MFRPVFGGHYSASRDSGAGRRADRRLDQQPQYDNTAQNPQNTLYQSREHPRADIDFPFNQVGHAARDRRLNYNRISSGIKQASSTCSRPARILALLIPDSGEQPHQGVGVARLSPPVSGSAKGVHTPDTLRHRERILLARFGEQNHGSRIWEPQCVGIPTHP